MQLVQKQLPEHQFIATGGFHIDSLAGVDVLIPTMCKITGTALEGANRLKLIQQCGSGLEGVDIAAALQKKIFVANVPTDVSGNADSVAELGIYLMIGLSRDIKGMGQYLRKGKMGQPQAKALSGRTVGIVGLGGIGRAMIRRLRGFGVRLIGIKNSDPQAFGGAFGLEWVGGSKQLPELLRQSDFVILCLPLYQSSMYLMNRKTLACMKSSAFLIDLSRSGHINRDDLYCALSNGINAG